jgi:hypothetical protein
VITVTPVAKCPITRRNSFFSIAIPKSLRARMLSDDFAAGQS